MSSNTNHSRLRFGRLITFLAVFVIAASLVGCGSSDQTSMDSPGPKITEQLTTAVATELDTFAKNMINLTAESNKYQVDVRNNPNDYAADLSALAAKYQEFTDRYRDYCADAQQGLASSSGDEESVWKAGSDWCTATVDMWSRATEVTSLWANGGPPVDATNPDDIALYKKSDQLSLAFSDAYCARGGVLCHS